MTKPPVRRRTASHQVSVALLHAAETVLDRDGTGGVTVRAVAHEAAVSPMSVYNKFENKDGLLVALAMRALDQLGKAIDVPKDVEPVERFRQACRRYREFALRHPARYSLNLWGRQSARRPVVRGGEFRSHGVRRPGRPDPRTENSSTQG
jgi:AcrR family transcriptional regulator